MMDERNKSCMTYQKKIGKGKRTTIREINNKHTLPLGLDDGSRADEGRRDGAPLGILLGRDTGGAGHEDGGARGGQVQA
jgi:hypothetical protein